MRFLMPALTLMTISLTGSFAESIEENTPYTVATDGHHGYATSDYSQPIVCDSEKVYFTYMTGGSVFETRVWSYNMKTGETAGPVNLGGRGDDPHDWPAITMDQDGYLNAFFACHAYPIYYRKTTSPRDISEWTPTREIGEYPSYPRPFTRENGNLACFYRNAWSPNHKYGYIESSDGGETWSEFRPLIWANGPYHSSAVYGGGVRLVEDEIHITWNWFHYNEDVPEPQSYDQPSYARFSFTEDIAYEIDGSEHDIPVLTEPVNEVEPIVDDSSKFAMDLTLDESDRPVALYIDYDGEGGDDGAKVAWWNGSQWDIETPVPSAIRFNQRFAHNPNGWVTLCTDTSSGLLLAQKKASGEPWHTRSLNVNSGTRFPVVIIDSANDRYHIFWHWRTTGIVQYLWSSGLDLNPSSVSEGLSGIMVR